MYSLKNKYKIIVLKKYHCAIVSVLLILSFISVSSKYLLNSKETLSIPLEGKVVLIDPGHGGVVLT